nr:proteoglycan 4-like [Kogia breviceps]
MLPAYVRSLLPGGTHVLGTQGSGGTGERVWLSSEETLQVKRYTPGFSILLVHNLNHHDKTVYYPDHLCGSSAKASESRHQQRGGFWPFPGPHPSRRGAATAAPTAGHPRRDEPRECQAQDGGRHGLSQGEPGGEKSGYKQDRGPDPEPRRPRAPETQSPGDPEPRRPGAQETRSPGDPEPRRPGDPDTRSPGDPEPRRPGAPGTRSPGDPEPRGPGDPGTQSPGDPEPRGPRAPETQSPGDPEPRRPRAQETQSPGAPEPRRPRAQETQSPGDPEPRRPRAPETQSPGDPEPRGPRAPETQSPRDPEPRRPRAQGTQSPGDPEPQSPRAQGSWKPCSFLCPLSYLDHRLCLSSCLQTGQ